MSVPLGVRSGYCTTTTCKFVVVSLSNEDITLRAGTFTQTKTPSGYPSGTPICWIADFEATLLDPFTQYQWHAIQGSKQNTGKFMTAPASGKDFVIFGATCDAPSIAERVDGGYYKYMREYAEGDNLPVVGLCFTDDLCYVDGAAASGLDDSAGTGLSAAGGNSEDSFAMGWLAWYGLLQDNTVNRINGGNKADRLWCLENINLFPQWGDHEFTDDTGWDSVLGTAFTNGKLAWDAFILPLQPPSRGVGISSLDTGANHWGMTLGDLYLVAIDGITNGSGDNAGAYIPPGTLTTCFGNNQIDDVLNAFNSNAEQFNVLAMANGVRYLSDPVGGEFNAGAQHAIFDHILAEYQRLFTRSAASPASLMDNDKTNGVAGTFMTIHGDYHRGMVKQHQAGSYSGNEKENFYSINMGSNNGGAITFAVDPADTYFDGATLPDTTNDTTLHALGGDFDKAAGGKLFWGTRIEIYGSKPQKQMHVYLKGAVGQADLSPPNFDQTEWSGLFMRLFGNSAQLLDRPLPAASYRTRKGAI